MNQILSNKSDTNRQEKIILNKRSDLINIPIQQLRTAKLKNFSGTLFEQIYKEAIALEHNQDDTVPDRIGKGFSVAGSQKLRSHNAGSHTDSHKQHNNQVQNRSGTAHSRQGIVSRISADNNTVHCIVQLLRNIADQHGHGEGYNLTPWRDFRHIYRPVQPVNPFSGFAHIFLIILRKAASASRDGGEPALPHPQGILRQGPADPSDLQTQS